MAINLEHDACHRTVPIRDDDRGVSTAWTEFAPKKECPDFALNFFMMMGALGSRSEAGPSGANPARGGTTWVPTAQCQAVAPESARRQRGAMGMRLARIHRAAEIIGSKSITCGFKHVAVPPKAVCLVGANDIARS
jgi:hypothetical protein